jgi:tetratricopeptide (TPR) repeat protein
LPTSSASPEPAPLDAPSETPTEENPQLAQAESYLEQGRPEMVHDLLWPSMEQWTSDEDKARGYFLLGMAEMDMGHPQLAAPYFERLFQYDPSPENLLYLAVAYDAGGNIGQALDTYKRLAAWDPSGEEIDIELVNQRIQDISLALGTPAPLPASTP